MGDEAIALVVLLGIVVVGITFLPGICHLIGATQAKK